MTPLSRTTGLLLGAAVASLALSGCTDDTTATDSPAPSSPPASSSPPPVEQPTEATSPATPSDGGGPGVVAVPLYFVGDTPQGPRLFREFQQVEGDNPLTEAAARVAGGQTLDPDYRTLWPSGGFADVATDEAGGRIVLTLADGGSPDEAVRLDPRQAMLAVQQMVYTLQGVTQTRYPLVVTTADGTPTSLFGIETADGIANADELGVLGLVNVTTPEQGATVSGSFTAEGLASSFEATVPWEVRDAGGAVVQQGFATADGYVDKLYPWTTEVDVSGLAAGDYTFVAMTDDPSDGEGGGPTEDTKAITVS